MTGNQDDARCFLLDAENLIRLRGMLKQHISNKVRLIHHVYTWMRVVGESTFLLHDYKKYRSVPEVLSSYKLNNDERKVLSILSQTRHTSTPQTGYSDCLLYVHDLADGNFKNLGVREALQGPDDLYLSLYGVPETWLKLLSQTSRLANIKDMVEQRDDDTERATLLEMLRKRIDQLESDICSILPNEANETPPQASLLTSEKGRAWLDTHSTCPTGHMHMLQALCYGLAIYFYRRVRNVHRHVLQGLVDGVIGSVTAFSSTTSTEKDQMRGFGTPWPAFIAGCEAVSEHRRKVLKDWIHKALLTCGLYSFRAAEDMMEVLWTAWDDEADTTSEDSISSKPKTQLTWVSLSRDHHLWLMLC